MRAYDIIDESKVWSDYYIVDGEYVAVYMLDGSKKLLKIDEFIKEIEMLQCFTKPEYLSATLKHFGITMAALGSTTAAFFFYHVDSLSKFLVSLAQLFGITISMYRLKCISKEGLLLDDMKNWDFKDIRVVYGDAMIEEAKAAKNKGISK